MNLRLHRRVACAAITVAMVSLALGGCGGVRLYDKFKGDMAASIKAKYANADILGTIEVQKENLKALLAEELKVVRENHQLQVDFALLELADNDSAMAETWRVEVQLPIRRLGFTTGQELRDFVMGLEETSVRDPQLAGLRRRIKKRIGVVPPPCGPDMGDLPKPKEIDENSFNKANKTYDRYKKACNKKLLAIESLKFGGKLGKAKKNWETAQEELNKKDEEIQKARAHVKAEVTEHEKAVKAAKDAKKKGDELRKAIKEAADRIRSNLEDATMILPEALSEALAEERLSSIITLLRAAAGESVAIENDPELAKAVLIVGGLASLSGDIAELVATAKAPSVRNLLIELQHQTVLLEHARALRTLQKLRVDILETEYRAYLKEASLLLDVRDAMCSFAFRHAGEPHPGKTCDQFDVSIDGKTCSTEQTTIDKTTNNGEDCVLSKPWKTFLNTSPPQEGATRQFYKALSAYTQIFPVRASQIEQDFNLIDLKHRENLATREMALKAWNNLAAVPIDQLDAYYQSGLKPDVIADLIVKALGFTAITVGVSQ